MEENTGNSEMSMIERRREMRRRRILANPDERLMKLTGEASSEVKASSSDVAANHSSCNNVSAAPQEVTTTESFVMGGDPPLYEQHTTPPPAGAATDISAALAGNPTSLNDVSGGAQLLDSLVSSALSGNILNMASSLSSNSTQVVDIFTLLTADKTSTTSQDSNNTTEDTARQAEAAAHQLSFYRARQFLCFLLGVIIRLSLLTSFGAEYVQTMVYPFVAMEIAFIGYQRATLLDISGSPGAGGTTMLVTMLRLIGMDKKLLDTYTQIMATINCTMDDFVTYFFSFVVTHVFLLWT